MDVVVAYAQAYWTVLPLAAGLWLIARQLRDRWSFDPRASLNWWGRNYLGPLLTLGIAVFLIAAYYALFKFLPRIQTAVDSIDGTTSPEDLRNLAQAAALLLGAVAIAAAIPFQLVKAWINERNTKTAEQGHITDRINKAVEMLGAEKQTSRVHDRAKDLPENKDKNGKVKPDSELVWEGDEPRYYTTTKSEPNLEVRLGAIYALERIARDSLDDHVQIMEILCAYVRENSPAKDAISIPLGKNTVEYKDLWREDWWHQWKDSIPPISADIQSIIDVIGRRSHEQLRSERGFTLDLRNCNFQKADFSEKNFEAVNFGYSFFDHCLMFRTRISSSNFRDAALNGADLEQASASVAEFFNAKIHYASLRHAQFRSAMFGMASMSGSNLYGARLEKSYLDGTDLFGCDLERVSIIEARLVGAILTGANLVWADCENADFLGADVRNVDLSNCKNLRFDQIESMFGDRSMGSLRTVLPEGISYDEVPHWVDVDVSSMIFNNLRMEWFKEQTSRPRSTHPALEVKKRNQSGELKGIRDKQR